jgi:hypothetical protein
MGGSLCSCFSASREARRSAMLSSRLERAASEARDRAPVELLMLGAPGAGKSTVFRQLRMLYGAKPERAERLRFVPAIHALVLSNMRQLLLRAEAAAAAAAAAKAAAKAASTGGGGGGASAAPSPLELEALQVAARASADAPKLNAEQRRSFERNKEVVLEHDASEPLTPGVAEAVAALWLSGEGGLAAAFALRRAFDGSDNAPYFFARAPELAKPGYVPSDDDMLRARMRTRGTVEGEFLIGDQKLRVIDVGGQRNEREKWVEHFEDVRAVVFVVSLADYDLAPVDDPSRNRLVEAMGLFHWAATHPSFRRSALVLLLNKFDVFEEKVRSVPLRSQAEGRFLDFADVRGGASPQAALEYVVGRFRALAAHRISERVRGGAAAAAPRVDRLRLMVVSACGKRAAMAKAFEAIKGYVTDDRLKELLRPDPRDVAAEAQKQGGEAGPAQ